MFRYTEIKPAPSIEKYISCYCILENCMDPMPRRMFRLIPEAQPQLVLYYGDDNYIDHQSDKRILPDHPLIGPLTTYRLFEAIGKVGLFSIVFKAEGLSLLINDSLKGLNDRCLASDLLGSFVNDLRNKILDAKNNQERISIADRELYYFFSKADTSKIKLPFNSIIRFIKQKDGNIDIDKLASQCNCSLSKLERHFKEIMSISPKKYAKIIRFQKAIRKGVQSTDLMDIAISLGYYDQSHFIKEFKSFTGYTPSSYFKSDENYKAEFLRNAPAN